MIDGTTRPVPTKRSVDHLSEMEQPGGEHLLKQGGFFEDRTFIPNMKDRKVITALVTSEMEMEDFVGVKLESPGAQLVTAVVQRLRRNSIEVLPNCYTRLFANISKETPVAGLLQVTKKEPLLILMSFARKAIDLSNASNINDLKMLKKEIPPFWDMLQSILKYEKS